MKKIHHHAKLGGNIRFFFSAHGVLYSVIASIFIVLPFLPLQSMAKTDIADEQALFTLGRSFFTIPWVVAPSATTARDGLGPLFNGNTCTSCHLNHGSFSTLDEYMQPKRSLVFRLSQPARHDEKPDHYSVHPDPVYGTQIAINGTGSVLPEANTRLRIHKQTFTFPDGSTQILTAFEPYLTDLNYAELSDETRISLRQPPILRGLGLIEAVSDEAIAAWADPDDENKDGISGRVNQVYDIGSGRTVAGRFNWKAGQPSIIQQVADAAANDLGLTNPLYPEELCMPGQTTCNNAAKGRAGPLGVLDLPGLRLAAIAHYVRLQPPPPTAKLNTQQRLGKQLFSDIGCAGCHRMQLTTQDGTVFSPYSDFLIHDMGEGLADNHKEFSADPQEWRTAPLWGMRTRIAENMRFLHDARAAVPLEAILWHDGEAKAVKERFAALGKVQRDAILDFLNTL